jgi:hypothetical protein
MQFAGEERPQVVDLALADAHGESLEYRFGRLAGLVAVDSGALGHEADELVERQRPAESGILFWSWPGRRFEHGRLEQRAEVLGQLCTHVVELLGTHCRPQRGENGAGHPLRGRPVGAHLHLDAAQKLVGVEGGGRALALKARPQLLWKSRCEILQLAL